MLQVLIFFTLVSVVPNVYQQLKEILPHHVVLLSVGDSILHDFGEEVGHIFWDLPDTQSSGNRGKTTGDYSHKGSDLGHGEDFVTVLPEEGSWFFETVAVEAEGTGAYDVS